MSSKPKVSLEKSDNYFGEIGAFFKGLLSAAFGLKSISNYSYDDERQRYDGWYNNMAHPNWGSLSN